MEYRKITAISHNLHLIKTNKFKMIFLKFIFRDEIDRNSITLRNLLLDNLTTTCKKYPTERLMNIKKQELYDLSIYSRNKRIGNHISSEICFSVLDSKYTSKETLEETIKFIKEIIFNPNVFHNSFNQNNFNVTKNILQENILSIRNYPKYLSVLRMKDYMDNNNPFSYNIDGYVEDLNNITPNSLYDYYKSFINNSLIDIYVIGNIDMYEMEKLIKDNFVFKTVKKLKCPIMQDYLPNIKTPKEIIEESLYNQSRLVIGCYFKPLDEMEKKYILVLYNMIFGNSPDSKLFRNIRELKSLAYDIESSYNKNDNILVITTGIQEKNYKLTLKAIKAELKSMAKGEFKEEDLNNSKEIIISLINEFEENPNSICEYYFSIDYLNGDNISTSISKIKEITKEDIVKVASKVKIDTIYFLREKVNESN